MAVFYCMAMTNDQTVSFTFGCTGVATVERTIVGMDVVMEFVVDIEVDNDLQEDIDLVERMVYGPKAHKVADILFFFPV